MRGEAQTVQSLVVGFHAHDHDRLNELLAAAMAEDEAA